MYSKCQAEYWWAVHSEEWGERGSEYGKWVEEAGSQRKEAVSS
jgi:hypothetical protein